MLEWTFLNCSVVSTMYKYDENNYVTDIYIIQLGVCYVNSTLDKNKQITKNNNYKVAMNI